MYSWGAGSNGQLGTGQLQDAAVPQPVVYPSQKTPNAVACGGNHVVALGGKRSSVCPVTPNNSCTLQFLLLLQAVLLGVGALPGPWAHFLHPRHLMRQTSLHSHS